MLSHLGDTQSNLKETIGRLFFLFYLGNAMFIINVSQSTFPLPVAFDACQVLICGELTLQLQLQRPPIFTVMPLGFLEGFQTNLKPEIKLQQDLNHYSFGGPP
jgi:hypothetical protein